MNRRHPVQALVGEGDDVRTVTALGRNAWALTELVKAGDAGLTPITTPGPRWSSYIHRLRRLGINIETVSEPHGGAYSGHHARYVLRDAVRIINEGGTI